MKQLRVWANALDNRFKSKNSPMKITIEYRNQKIQTGINLIFDFAKWCADNHKFISPKTFELFIKDMAEN